MNKLLLVCTGNIIRSACAQILLNKMYACQSDSWQIVSAGTHAQVGAPMHPNMAQLLLAMGITGLAHKAQLIDADLVAQSDMVVTMERSHKEFLRSNYPTSKGKIFMFAGTEDVPDPLGQPKREYEQVVEQILQGAKQWAAKLDYLA